jgi:hypothetical protein
VVHVQAAVALVGAGALIASAGWWGTSHSAVVPDQVLWTAVAIAGLLVEQLGTAWLLLAGRLALRRRHGRLAHRLALAGGAIATGPEGGGIVVAGARMTRYHRRDCAAVVGKAVVEASAAEQRRAGRRPCQLCLPDR